MTDEASDDEGAGGGGSASAADADAPTLDELEEKYDFDDFGPAEMAEMSADEWEAAFDPESWVTGPELLDRVEQDLTSRVARREVFAVVERERHEGDERLLAYSDEGYAVVYGDGTVEGRGTVLRDVKPTVALCSMPDYEPLDVEVERGLPDPDDVTGRGSELGNLVLQVVGLTQVVAGVVLFGAWVVYGLHVVAAVVALGFLGFGALLLTVVANARLSDRFRAEQYRERLRSAGVETGERPAFVPGSRVDGAEDDAE